MTSRDQRFWAKVDKNGPMQAHMTTPCWTWTGSLRSDGYGSFWMDARRSVKWWEPSHRASWILTNGDIPSGLSVLHKCDFPACVRPSHLFLGTQLENLRDMAVKRRSPSGESHHSTSLTEHRVRELREDFREGLTIAQIAAKHAVGYGTVKNIVKGVRWKYVT